jgi:hypothetical protein
MDIGSATTIFFVKAFRQMQ